MKDRALPKAAAAVEYASLHALKSGFTGDAVDAAARAAAAAYEATVYKSAGLDEAGQVAAKAAAAVAAQGNDSASRARLRVVAAQVANTAAAEFHVCVAAHNHADAAHQAVVNAVTLAKVNADAERIELEQQIASVTQAKQSLAKKIDERKRYAEEQATSLGLIGDAWKLSVDTWRSTGDDGGVDAALEAKLSSQLSELTFKFTVACDVAKLKVPEKMQDEKVCPWPWPWPRGCVPGHELDWPDGITVSCLCKQPAGRPAPRLLMRLHELLQVGIVGVDTGM